MVAQHAKRIGGGARVGMLRVGGGQGLAAEAGDNGGVAGQGGQSEASAECRAELGVGEGEAAGGWECLEPRGGAGAGHAAKPSLCDLSVCGAAVQASEKVLVGCLGLVEGECA
jgi:hypothetical protein